MRKAPQSPADETSLLAEDPSQFDDNRALEGDVFRDRPSKSQRKRDMHDLQELGESLTELPVSRLDKLDMPENLMDALREFHRTRSFEGKRRQMQYIGKLMRGVDDAPLRAAVAEFHLGSARQTLALHEAERWREELIASDDAITRWIAEHPGTDVQRLRQMVRAARQDAKLQAQDPAGTPARRSRSYRELFAVVKAGLAGGNPNGQGESDEEDDEHED
jgi:ribosome-associated protein